MQSLEQRASERIICSAYLVSWNLLDFDRLHWVWLASRCTAPL